MSMKEKLVGHKLTAAQFAEAMARGKARAEAMSVSVGGGCGDYTKERHERQRRSHEEIVTDIMRIQEERAATMRIAPRVAGK